MTSPPAYEKQGLNYRPEVDGLRALAVLSVLFSHLGLDIFSGGFVGVDIFFVISGFLITSIIVRETTKGGFSILRFYERRVRRIAPALFTVLIFCICAAYILYLPLELNDFSESLIAAVAFLSNIYFWSETDYFSASPALNPLLHLWSLAVEEQFYILFPLLLSAGILHAPRYLVPLIATFLVASLLFSIRGVENNPSDAFYLAHLRAWEFLLGAFLALKVFKAHQSTLLNNSASLLGLSLILWSVFTFTPTTPFPGLNALFPVVGTGLIIYADSKTPTLVGRLLSLRPVVWIGLISYSLYLWHWPLITFARYHFQRPLDSYEATTIGIASILIAHISWKFIEEPFRKRSLLSTQRALFSISGGLAVLFLIAGVAGDIQEGFPKRFAHQVDVYERGRTDGNPDRKMCHDKSPEQVLSGNLCKFGPDDGSPAKFMVWGDSHANALMPAFKKVAAQFGTSGLYAGYRACPPFLSVGRADAGPHNKCTQFNDAVASVIRTKKIQHVVLIGRWAIYLHGHYGEIDGDQTDPFLQDALSTKVSSEESKKVFQRGLNRTLSMLKDTGVTIWIVEQIPVARVKIPAALARAFSQNKSFDSIAPTIDEHATRQKFVRRVFSDMEKKFSLHRIDPSTALCGDQKCRIAANGRSLYRDDDHISAFGAVWISDVFLPMFDAFNASKNEQ